MDPAVAELNRRFGIPDIAKVVAGNGGLAKVCVTSAAATGEVYLHGAHVTSWQPRGAEEVLFVSAKSRWESGRAIRGGIPICFPWFANNANDPRRRRTDSCERQRGSWSPLRRSAMRLGSTCSPKAMKARKNGGLPTFVWSIASPLAPS
jgi:hypothetical protein